MGTHPIFEPDFDCLTEVEMLRAATRSAIPLRRASEIPAGAMSFSFASPIQEFYTANQDVIQVDIPTMTGTIGILPQHVPTFGVLAPGVVTIMRKGSAEKYFVSSGSYTVNADSSVNIIAEEAAPLSDFDKDAAQTALNSVQTGTAEGDVEAQVLQSIVNSL